MSAIIRFTWKDGVKKDITIPSPFLWRRPDTIQRPMDAEWIEIPTDRIQEYVEMVVQMMHGKYTNPKVLRNKLLKSNCNQNTTLNK